MSVRGERGLAKERRRREDARVREAIAEEDKNNITANVDEAEGDGSTTSRQ